MGLCLDNGCAAGGPPHWRRKIRYARLHPGIGKFNLAVNDHWRMTMRRALVMFAWPLALGLALGLAACSDDTDAQDAGTTKDMGQDAPRDGKPAEAGSEAGTDLSNPDAAPELKRLVILHTNDLHDHMQGWAPNADYTPGTTGDDSTVGGFARLATQIAAERAAAKTANSEVLLLDAGDFTMGSLFTWLNMSKVPVLSQMQKLGYDAITLGNHEFDWTPDGLAKVLVEAQKVGFKVPIVSSNLKFDATKADDDNLEQLVKAGVIKTKLTKTLANGLKVGFIGIMGKGAADVAFGAAPVTFDVAKDVVKKLVKELRETDKVDLVVVISHSGISSDGKAGEDLALAKAVNGIDVIISGHTHTATKTPAKFGTTVIVQTGSYGQHLGKLELEIQGSSVHAKKYTLLALDDKVAGDTATQKVIDGYVTDIDAMLKAAGSPLTYKTPIAELNFDLTFPAFAEATLGNLVTDAYRAVVTGLTPLEPVHVALESGGVVRDEISKGKTGKLWLADAYRVLPLGVGPDQVPGYPLVDFYITGRDLKNGMEMLHLAKFSMQNNDYFLQVSGIAVEYYKSSGGTLFNRVKSIKMGTPPTTVDTAKCDPKTQTCKCYRVVTNLLVGLQISAVSSKTMGQLSVIPRQKDCKTEIKDIRTRVIKVGGKELKAWQALVQFLAAQKDTDSDKIPDVPASYGKLQQRIVELP